MYKPWPINCKRKMDQGGTERPVDPSSIFGTTNLLCFTQTLISPNRKVYSWSVSAESRSAKDQDASNNVTYTLCWYSEKQFNKLAFPFLVQNSGKHTSLIVKTKAPNKFWIVETWRPINVVYLTPILTQKGTKWSLESHG